MTTNIIGRDIYVRHTSTTGHAFVAQHRVWAAGRFMAAREDDAAQLNAAVKGDGQRLAKVEQITEEQYRDERR